jgi:hypothetical protein
MFLEKFQLRDVTRIFKIEAIFFEIIFLTGIKSVKMIFYLSNKKVIFIS